MNDKPANLEQIQRWMQSVITHPGGVAAGVGSPEARQYLDVSPADLETVIQRSTALGSHERLEIYVDAYFERLLECLREEFTATRHALGDELMNGLAFGYLQRCPSRSYTLNVLGAGFPSFLAESRLHAHEAPSDGGASWTDFIVELAAFERLLRDVFDGPGSERFSAMNFDRLQDVSAADRGRLRLVPCPSLKLQRFQHPVHSYWAAFKAEELPDTPELRDTCLALHRQEYVVHRNALAPAQFELLNHLWQGKNFSAALSEAAQSPDTDWQFLAGNLETWFAEWILAGYFVGFELEPEA